MEELEMEISQNRSRNATINHHESYVCGSKSNSNEELVPQQSCEKKCFECNECGYKTKRPQDLRRHLSSLTADDDVDSFKCSYCSHTFMEDVGRRNHERVHVQNGKLPCCLCEMRFPGAERLENHVRKVHMKKKEFKCSVCGAGYFYKSHLNRHIRDVSRDLPYRCYVCGHRYSSTVGLRRHGYQHGKTKLFKCPFCLNKFSTEGHLTLHLGSRRKMKQYQCSGCKKRFTTSWHLLQHMETYGSDRPFRCSVCGHTLTSQGLLATHMKLHTGESWKCLACGDTFKTRDLLKTHLQIHSRGSSNVSEARRTRSDSNSYQPKLPHSACPPNTGNLSCTKELRSIRHVSTRKWSSLRKTQVLELSSKTPHNQQHYSPQQAGHGDKMLTDNTCLHHDSKQYKHNPFPESVQESHHSAPDMDSYHQSHQKNPEVESDVFVDVEGLDEPQPGDLSTYNGRYEQRPYGPTCI